MLSNRPAPVTIAEAALLLAREYPHLEDVILDLGLRAVRAATAEAAHAVSAPVLRQQVLEQAVRVAIERGYPLALIRTLQQAACEAEAETQQQEDEDADLLTGPDCCCPQDNPCFPLEERTPPPPPDREMALWQALEEAWTRALRREGYSSLYEAGRAWGLATAAAQATGDPVADKLRDFLWDMRPSGEESEVEL